jgi:hypothetical protein
MEYLVIYLIVYALIQMYLYSVIAPNNRMRLRYKLYAIRDEIRMMEFKQKEHGRKEVKTRTFIRFNRMLNYATSNMKEFNLYNMVSTRINLEENPDEKKRIDDFYSEIKNSPNERLRVLFEEFNDVLMETLAYNSVGYIFFGGIVATVLMLVGLMKKIYNGFEKSMMQFGIYAQTPTQGPLGQWFRQAGVSIHKTMKEAA